jgi:single-strand DNA-binding protein
MSVNKVIILGRLGQDPELKNTPSGAAVCNFSMATSESWNDKNTGQKQEKTEWHRIVVWGKLAELCNQYLSKGRQCYVEGSLQTRSWDDEQGNKRYSTEVNARTVQFIGSIDGENKKPASDSGEQKPDYNVASDPNFANDDIPF